VPPRFPMDRPWDPFSLHRFSIKRAGSGLGRDLSFCRPSFRISLCRGGRSDPLSGEPVFFFSNPNPVDKLDLSFSPTWMFWFFQYAGPQAGRFFLLPLFFPVPFFRRPVQRGRISSPPCPTQLPLPLAPGRFVTFFLGVFCEFTAYVFFSRSSLPSSRSPRRFRLVSVCFFALVITVSLHQHGTFKPLGPSLLTYKVVTTTPVSPHRLKTIFPRQMPSLRSTPQIDTWSFK